MLFVINFFITFFLLEATAKITKRTPVIWRFILASTVGGAYSLIILATLPQFVSVLLKAVVAAVIILIAFSFLSVKSFAFTYALFFAANFVFLGVIYGIAVLLKTPYIQLSNGTVYVNISARGLVISAFFAYVISCAVLRVYNRRLAASEVYTLTVENGGESVKLYAFTDTGNRLREPFSDYPVIIADVDKVAPLATPEKTRIIPASTINRKSFLTSFKPDRVTIKTERGTEVVENVYIAMSDEVGNETFSAVINPEILSV